jgi:hypothetical protein
LALLILFALSLTSSMHALTDAINYGFDVSIVPEQNQAGIYQAKFTVINLNGDKVIVAPTIRFRAGEPASSSSTADDSGVVFDFSVSVDKEASIAQYQVKAHNVNGVISSVQAKVALSK